MAFSFIRQSCVALGTFNIYVIQPKWLVTEGIIDRASVPLITDFNMTRPGLRFKTNEKTTWTIEPHRIIVESTERAFDCGERVAEILHRLVHTPITAVGANANFRCKSSDAFDDLTSFYGEGTPERRIIEKAKVASLAEGPAKKLNLSLRLDLAEARTVVLTLNVHSSIIGDEASVAESAARHFLADIDAAKSEARNVFGDRIEYDAR
jgi:hypothetical protein